MQMDTEPVRILVVDDSTDSAQTLAVLLRLNGYDVRTASTGEEALALIEERMPHCVVFDVVMPGIGGDELCRRLRERHGDDIVLIAVSGYAQHDMRVGTCFALADHFLTKPVDPMVLAKVLRPVR
jgi:CheY-like chemotaxis protein